MIRFVEIILRDFFGLWRICGGFLAIRWLILIPLNAVPIFRRGDLQPADQALGAGPFHIKIAHINSKFWIKGPSAISGIREMYVRDAYLHNGTLSIADGDTVLDLGANMGNFTNLALAHGRNVRVVAVEPNRVSNSVFHSSLKMNEGFSSRASLVRTFVGLVGNKQELLIASDDAYQGATWMSEGELLSKENLDVIDFLKCDIEGGEFDLLDGNSKLLAMTKSLAIEVHSFAGDVDSFLENIEASGFDILSKKWDPDGTCTALARRP